MSLSLFQGRGKAQAELTHPGIVKNGIISICFPNQIGENTGTCLVLHFYVRPFYQKKLYNVASSGLYCNVQGSPPVLKTQFVNHLINNDVVYNECLTSYPVLSVYISVIQ